MPDLEPLWRTPTRSEAMQVLSACRASTMEIVGELDDRQMKTVASLGGGSWSVKDLLGHLAGYEEQAVAIATGKKPPFDFGRFRSVDERNAADLERKRAWTVKRVRKDLEVTRSELLEVIDNMDDERWSAKIRTRTGYSGLALVLGRLLVGGRHGLYAHDLAHIVDLRKSVRMLLSTQGGSG